jgi:Xaa-Pro aminopeptidase
VSAFERRAERLLAPLSERELDMLLVTSLVNVRYLCGFAGTNGVCVVGRDGVVFITDFRYAERARAEVSANEVIEGERDLLGNVASLAAERIGEGRLGFDDADVSVARHAKLAKLLPAQVELVAAGGLVERLRAVKDEDELDRIRAAASVADEVYRWLIQEHGLAGHSERAVALALGRRCQDLGADDVAFPPIVAAGENGALPHASPRDVEIPRDSLVVVDLGCRLDGYCSDCTRTFATGDVDEEAREVYELVRSAQDAAVAAVRAGAGDAAVDAVARERIAAAGRGDQFGHGTGHGVGLEVHEEPRLAATAEGELAAGNVVTVEPGVYVPGRFGVRIEDLVVVREGGHETFTSVPRELTVV